MSTDEEAIRTKLHAFVEAFNAGDAEQLGALFVEDADFINIFGLWMKGRTALVEGHAHAFKGFLGATQLAMTGADVKLRKPDLALCHVSWRREQVASHGLPTEDGVMTVVLTKRDDQWWYIAAHNTRIVPMPG